MNSEDMHYSELFQIMPGWKQEFIKKTLSFIHENMIEGKMLCGDFYDINILRATFEKLCELCELQEVKRNRLISENRQLFQERITFAGSTDERLSKSHSLQILRIAGVSE